MTLFKIVENKPNDRCMILRFAWWPTRTMENEVVWLETLLVVMCVYKQGQEYLWYDTLVCKDTVANRHHCNDTYRAKDDMDNDKWLGLYR